MIYIYPWYWWPFTICYTMTNRCFMLMVDLYSYPWHCYFHVCRNDNELTLHFLFMLNNGEKNKIYLSYWDWLHPLPLPPLPEDPVDEVIMDPPTLWWLWCPEVPTPRFIACSKWPRDSVSSQNCSIFGGASISDMF